MHACIGVIVPVSCRDKHRWCQASIERCCWWLRADTFHKPGFKMHARILHHLFSVAGSDVVKGPLWDAAAQGAPLLAVLPVPLRPIRFPKLSSHPSSALFSPRLEQMV